MADPASLRRYAQVFDRVAADYDAYRSGYPPELVDRALDRGGLGPGARVLEIGSGTGKLTETLAARGLEVDAVEPGPQMTAAARARVGDAPNVRFHLGRFEEVELPEDGYDAAFSATAFHWVEPEPGWRKLAAHLRDGGVVALLVYAGVATEETAPIDLEFRGLVARQAPDIVAGWPPFRSLEQLLADARDNGDNPSRAWDSIMFQGEHDLAVDVAGELFHDVRVDHVLTRDEADAELLIGRFRTTSLWARIAHDRHAALERDLAAFVERNGGTIPNVVANTLMTARRRPR